MVQQVVVTKVNSLTGYWACKLDDPVHGASRGRSSHNAAHSKMVKVWRDGGRPMVGTADGYAAGPGGFTVARQRVPALQFRSLGKRLAPEVGARRGRGHQIC